MPFTEAEITNAGLDIAFISAVATQPTGTATNRLGETRKTLGQVLLDLAGTDIEGPLAASLDGRIDNLKTQLESTTVTLPANPFGYVFAVVDSDGYVGLAVTEDGMLVTPESELESKFAPMYNNPFGYVYAVVDDDGYVGFAITKTGEFVSSSTTQVLTAPLYANPYDYALVLVDDEGYVGFAVRNNGTTVSAQDANDTDSGDPITNPVVFMDGATLKMVTSYGTEVVPGAPSGIKYPSVVAGNHIEFVSNFLDGVARKFRMALDGTCLTPEPGGVVNMICGDGQSNRQGAYAPITSEVGTEPKLAPYNLMYNGGPNPGNRFQIDPYVVVSPANIDRFVPLHEISQVLDFDTNPGGEVLHGETSNSATAWALNRAIYAAVRTYQTLLMCDNGVSSTSMAGLKKGTIPYSNRLTCVTRAKTLCDAAGQRLIVRAVHMVHGEGDAARPEYASELVQHQADLQTDIQAITGQDEPVHLFLTQHSAWNFVGNTPHQETNGLLSTFIVDSISIENPLIHLIGPKYQFLYPVPGDGIGLHMDGLSQDELGLDFVRAHKQVVLDGKKFHALGQRTEITRTGAIIDVKFLDVVDGLVLDDSFVTDPGNYGFEYTSSGSPPAISSVAVKAGTTDTIRIILASDPGAAANKRVRYGFTSTPGAGGGRYTGPRGCLRDGDAVVAPWNSSFKSYKRCIHFNKTLT